MVVLQVVAETIRSLTKSSDQNLSDVIAEIERLIDDAISGVAIRAPIPSGNDMKKLFDLSSLDFDELAGLFAQGSKKTAAAVLQGKAEQRARRIAAKNPTRIDLVERLQKLIDQYNTGSLDIEKLFQELKQFCGDLDEEEQRHLREGLSEEELAVFDILTQPEPKLTKTQEVEVKKIARAMLEKLKREKLIFDWRIKDGARSAVRQTIREEYDQLPDAYERRIWEDKVERTYQFVFERYDGAQGDVQ